MTGAARIDDRQTPMAQADLAPLIIDRFRRPNTLVITASMLECNEHPSHTVFRITRD
jgi:hypothetical protein